MTLASKAEARRAMSGEWHGRAGRWPPLLAVLVLALSLSLPMATGPARAQSSLKDRLGGFSTNPDAPIDIEADALEVDDVKKTAIFRGNVKAVQGDFTLRSKEMVVTYSGSAGKGKGKGKGKVKGKSKARSGGAGAGGLGSGAGSQITRIDARGKVLITSKDQRSATSDWAIFNVEGQTVTIGGHAVLSQNGDVIKAEKVVIDLATGRTRFEMRKQRVRMLVKPRARPDRKAGAGKAKAGGDKTGRPGAGATWRVDVAPGGEGARARTSSSPVMRQETSP